MSSLQRRSVGKTKPRPTERLGRHLEKNLLAYAAAASGGLLAATLPAEAQIVYTPSNTPWAIAQENKGLAITPLDINNDGIPDFAFAMLSTLGVASSGTTTRFKFYLRIAPGQNGNEAVQGVQAPLVSAVPAGVTIGPKEKFSPGARYLALTSFNGSNRTSGTWQDVEFAYVGLKFLINGQVHYGWARIKFPYPGGTHFPSIYGYAYEATPNHPIVTGQISGTAPASTTANVPAGLGVLAAGVSGVKLWRGRN
jgi:hypothetical protein